jgi:hypothetical protein
MALVRLHLIAKAALAFYDSSSLLEMVGKCRKIDLIRPKMNG